jgi:hypothetical protein
MVIVNNEINMQWQDCTVYFCISPCPFRLVEQIFPNDGEDWEEVARLHNLNFPTNGRDMAKLKSKFQQMYRVKMPTGDLM